MHSLQGGAPFWWKSIPSVLVDGKLMAMDSKFVIDNHARSHAGKDGRAGSSDDRSFISIKRLKRRPTTITYVPLDGDLGLISDGAGTGMLTLDLLNDAGGHVASFCELGGMTTAEVMYRAMDLTLDRASGGERRDYCADRRI